MRRIDTRKHITLLYALLQILYWSGHCFLIGYSTSYLKPFGFSNSDIGAVLGMSYAISFALQPTIANVISRTGTTLRAAIACAYTLIGALMLCLIVLPMRNIGLAVVLVATLSLISAMETSINSLSHQYRAMGLPLNFGLARGGASLGYAILSALVGLLLERVAATILPMLALSSVVLLLAVLATLPARGEAGETVAERASGERGFLLRRYPRYGLYLLGVACLAVSQIFVDNFTIQIIEHVGGSVANAGIVKSISAGIELPAMFLFSWYRKYLHASGLLKIASWSWVAKITLVLLAKTPTMIYLAVLFQGLSYAIFVPASIEYVGRVLPSDQYLRGQALSGSAYTLGCVSASMLGGRLLDLLGVKGAEWIVLGFALTGAALFAVGTPKSLTERRS